MKILIVEDSEACRMLLRRTLQTEGFDVIEAVDGIEALAVLRRELADVVISDILMPNMDGYRLIHEIRRDEQLKGLNVIIYSSTYSSPSDAKLSLELGANAFLRKPSSREVLKATIARITTTKEALALCASLEGADVLKPYSERLVQLLESRNDELSQRTAELAESEEKFLQFAENMLEVLWMANVDGTEMLYVSPAYEKVWGRSLKSLFARAPSWTDTIHPDDRKRVESLTASEAQKEDGYAVEYRIVRPDGTERWIQNKSFSIKDSLGKVYRTAGIATDVTEQRLAGEERRRLSAVVEATSDMVGIADLNGKVIFLNSAGRRWFGFAETFDITSTCFRDYHSEPTYRRIAEEAIPAALCTGWWQGEVLLKRANGTEFPVSQVILSHKNSAGESESISTICRDISERKQAEADLRRSAEELRESERRFRDMLLNVKLVSLMLDKNAQITYCNDYFLRVTGWRQEEVLGKNWFEQFIPQQSANVRAVFDQLLLDQPGAAHFENEIVTRSGERRLIRWNNSVLRSIAGDVIGTSSIGEDITERRQAEESLKKRAAELEQFHRLSIGREMQMIELKKEVNEMAKHAGRTPPYDLSFLDKSLRHRGLS